METRDLDEYLLSHKVMLEVRGKLVKATDDTNYAATDVITLVNNGWSLFRCIQYQIDGHVVEDVNQYLLQASTIMNLVRFLDDYGRSTATNMCWYGDTAKRGAELNQFSVPGAALLLETARSEGDLDFAGYTASITGNVFREQLSYPKPLAVKVPLTLRDTLSV